MKLSDRLSQCRLQRHKWGCCNQLITEIGQLPAAAGQVHTVYLSNNRLRNLQGIGQFAAAQKLSLACNRIAAFSALAPLQDLRALSELRMEDNPVARLPHYRAWLIALLPSLKVLDGVHVTPAETAQAPRCIRHMQATLDLMVANACNAHKLVRASSCSGLRCIVMVYGDPCPRRYQLPSPCGA